MAINGKRNAREGEYRVAIDLAHGQTATLAVADDRYRNSLIALVIYSSEATALTIESFIDPTATPLTGAITLSGSLSWQVDAGFCCTDLNAALRLKSTGGSGTVRGFAVYAKER